MISRVAVVGAGTMGTGIAQLCAQQGFSVKVFDAFPPALEGLPKNLKERLDAAVLKGKLTTSQAERAYHSVAAAESLAQLAGADLVIEAASEDLALKKKLFAELARVCPDAILATNTSSLSVTAIATAAENPQRVLGLHFFNPPAAMKLVEMVRTPQTSPAAFSETWDFVLVGLKKTPVDVKDTPGFIVNRVVRPYYLEAQRLAGEGASFAAVDAACRQAGLPMGPFELMDLIGLDVNLAITKTIYESLGRPERLKPPALQERLVAAGCLGRKNGLGFYAYTAGRDREVNAVAAEVSPFSREFPQAALWGRVKRALIAEAEFARSEGVAGPVDIDTAVKLAMNFPQGPFEWQKEEKEAQKI